MIFSEIEGIIGVLMLGSTLVVQTRSYIRPMTNTVVTQSILLAVAAVLIGVNDNSFDLIILAVLIVTLRGFMIRHVLDRRLPPSRVFAKEYSHGVSSVTLASVIVLISSFLIYRYSVFPLVNSPLGAIGLSIIIQGLLLISTRKNSFAHFIGYVEEENGIVFLSLTVIPLPLLIEISVLLDVLALVIAGAVLVKDSVEHTKVEELVG